MVSEQTMDEVLLLKKKIDIFLLVYLVTLLGLKRYISDHWEVSISVIKDF